MKQLAIAAVAMLMFLGLAKAQGIPFESVVPIQEIKVSDDGTAELANVCGAVSINQHQRYWLTANHCLDDTDASYIRGEKVKYIMRDIPNDLAIVQTITFSAPAVTLAPEPLTLGEHVYTISYPLGLTAPFYMQGTVANERYVHEIAIYVIYQFPVAPGSSGSPVFNDSNELVSVTQRGFVRGGFSPIGSGAHMDKLEALAIWWEK